MEHRAFTPEHFRDFHPGGKLGAQLSLVNDLMHAGDALPLVHLGTPMSDALIEISQKGFGVVGVVNNDGTLVGIVTDGDLRRHMDGLLSLTAQDVMTKAPTTITPQSLAEKAVHIMNDRKITCLFVVPQNTGAPTGLLHIHDCLRVGLG
jgi:arabinose-5-phosphate isomerase